MLAIISHHLANSSTEATDILSIGGICWIITYIIVVVIGFRQKTYGMPAIALMLNVAWECVYGFVCAGNQPGAQKIINIVWTGLDLVILATFVLYGKKYIPERYQKLFCLNVILGLVVCFLFQYNGYHFFHIKVDDLIPYPSGMVAFMQNLLMSVLFVDMLVRRGSTEGQSMYIALFKLLGTLLTAVALIVGTSPEIWARANFIIYFLAAATFIYDVIYTVLLYLKFREEGKKAFRFLW